MKKILSILLVAILSLGVFSACGSNPPAETTPAEQPSADAEVAEESAEEPQETSSDTVVIEHLEGSTEVPVNPEKIVVMDFGMLDTMDQLGVQAEYAVPANNIPAYLDGHKETALNIGGLKEYDMEAIHGFEPDLIILGARQRDDYANFVEIAPTIVLSADNERYLESSIENIKSIGKIFAIEEDVDAQLGDIEDKLAQLNEITAGENMSTLILLTNEGGISVYGPGSRFGIIHDSFGFPPVDEEIQVSTHGQEINYEYISKYNPDYIFVVDRTAAIGGDVLANETLDNDLVNATTAAKNNHIVMLNPDVWYLSGGGLMSLHMMIDEVLENVQ